MQRVQLPIREGHAEAPSAPRSAPAERSPARSGEAFDAQVARASRSRGAAGRAEDREARVRREPTPEAEASRSTDQPTESVAEAREPADSPVNAVAARDSSSAAGRAAKASKHGPASTSAAEMGADSPEASTPSLTATGPQAVSATKTSAADLAASLPSSDAALPESAGLPALPQVVSTSTPTPALDPSSIADNVAADGLASKLEPKSDASKSSAVPLASLADGPFAAASAPGALEPTTLPSSAPQVSHDRAQVAEIVDVSFAQRLDEHAARAARAERSAEVAADILRQVRMNLSGDLREATLQLTPEHLGRVSIRLRIEDGTMRAELRAQTPEALAALERHAPELRAALGAQAGSERAVDLRFGAMPFGAHSGAASGRGRAFGSRGARSNPALETPSLAPLEGILARRLSNGGIDTYA